jgi:uncharacterized membrane-anchored protein
VKDLSVLPHVVVTTTFGTSINSSGEGSERVASCCQLAFKTSPASFAFEAMVAKATNLVQSIEENMAFYLAFVETQNLAASLADNINHRLLAFPGYD